MKYLRLLAIALIMSLLAACGDPSTGQVTAKRYEEAYTSYVMMCSVYGAKGVCTLWMPVPYTSGPFWVLSLKNGEDEWEELSSPAQYERIHIGDTWTEK